MAATSAKSFLRLLKKSELVSPEQLSSALRELKKSAAGAVVNLDQLAGHLVERELITQWHSDKLASGKFKGFFLGKYKLLGHLGTGGMSTVYLAEHTLSGQRRAIKVLPRKKVADKSYLDRFYREGRASAALNHPNIVRVYDIAGEDTTHYLVMEFVEGTDLYELVKQNGPLGFDQAVQYVLQAATGLRHAHERKLVHRDIKPANLLVSPGGTVKVLDLGLALLKSDDEESLTVMHNERVMGTADYLAPEQAVNSHRVDHRADIYSLGCTLYYLLTGHPPFPEGTLAQRIAAHQTEEPSDICLDRPDCPPRLIRICQKMMRKRRSERFQNCSELLTALDAYRSLEHMADAEFDLLVATPESEIVVDTNRKPDPAAAESIATEPRRSKKALRSKKGLNASPRELRPSRVSHRHKRIPLAVILSIATLMLVSAGLGMIWMKNYFQVSGGSAANSSAAELQNQTTAVTAKTANDARTRRSPRSDLNRKHGEEGNSSRLPVFSAGASSDPETNPLQTLTTVNFESNDGSDHNLQDCAVYANNTQIGTLRCRRDCELVQDPHRGKKCLLVYGNSEKVEFRPVQQDRQLMEIRFLARRQNDESPFSFKVEVKSLDRFEQWKPVFAFDSSIDDLNSKEYSEIRITEKELGLINAQKFRFKLEGQPENGILIDDLSIILDP